MTGDDDFVVVAVGAVAVGAVDVESGPVAKRSAAVGGSVPLFAFFEI